MRATACFCSFPSTTFPTQLAPNSRPIPDGSGVQSRCEQKAAGAIERWKTFSGDWDHEKRYPAPVEIAAINDRSPLAFPPIADVFLLEPFRLSVS